MITGQTVGGSSIAAEWWSTRESCSRASVAKILDPGAQVSGLGIADQQIVEIAKALSRNARLLIMDEPTSSLTPHEVAALLGSFASFAGGAYRLFLSVIGLKKLLR